MSAQDLVPPRTAALCVLALTVLLLGGCGGGGSGGPPPPPPPPPPTFSYPAAALYVAGQPMTLTPTGTTGLSNFSVEFAVPLPAGLTLDPNTGVISGTPRSIGSQTYTIGASGAGGKSASTTVTLKISPVAANVISYGASALTFTAGIAARTLTPETAAAATGWSITPQLPAGLAFNTTTGAITGTPTAASPPTMYMVTAQNSAGQPLSVNFTIEVDTAVLVDLGHNTAIVTVQFNGSTLLSEDQSGHWVLWNYATGVMIASGRGCTFDEGPGPIPCVRGPYAAMAGSTAVIRVYHGFEVRSAATGALIATITVPLDLASLDTGGAWWLLATDGSYIVAGTTQGLSVWSPSGQLLASRLGNYSAANAFASPGALRVAVGPAGANVLETISVPSGTDTVSPSFNGNFTSWFADGSAFFSTVGTTVLIYTDAVVQEAVLNMPASTFYGEGPWLWTFSASGINIYALASPTTLVASYPCAGSPATSASTIAAFSTVNSNAFCVIDLSGATPAEANYTSSIPGGGYAAASASQFVITDAGGYGVLIDGASLSGTPRYFGYGQALSIAGNANQIAVATAIGKILYFDAATLQQEGTIPYLSAELALSPDGTILAAAPASLYGLPPSHSLNVYSLPTGSLTYSWPPGGAADISLAGSGAGTVLGQASGSGVMISAPTGGTPSFSATGQSLLQLAPDVTSVATSSTVNPGGAPVPWVGFGTNIYQNGTLVTAVDGWPVGWIDGAHLLVNTYQPDYFVDTQTDYIGCALYGPTGTSAGTCGLPQVLSFQSVTSDTLYANNLNEILSVSTGAVSWASGDALAPYSPFVDALAGNHVVFVSGSQVVAQSY